MAEPRRPTGSRTCTKASRVPDQWSRRTAGTSWSGSVGARHRCSLAGGDVLCRLLTCAVRRGLVTGGNATLCRRRARALSV